MSKSMPNQKVAQLEPLTERSVHVCCDMQRLFSAEGPWPTPWMDRTLPAIVEIAERHAGQTVFTRFIPPEKSTDMAGQWQSYFDIWCEVTRQRVDPRLLDLVPPLARLVPPAVVVDKPVYSPFTGWRLPTILRERKADAVVVTGAETDVCVLATVLGAVDLGYRVVLVSDAVCSSSDDGHDALMTMYRQRYSIQIAIADAVEVLDAWRPSTAIVTADRRTSNA
jgi:nicotinamidase-related amidase